ncbi:Xylose isomerase domain protein TIM barrel [Candidatus Sulfopaludibacter sp. SbA3]|nr:Xylose isomerase domain protein TIM barrel [Candidatus Sulfopaludibacter sp. SbA3]
MTSRRSFLKATALSAALSKFAPAAQLTEIGVQLYTVRTVLPQKPAETLNAIRAIGYNTIEGTLAGFDKIWPDVQASGLKPVSMHLDANQVMQRSDEFARTTQQLKQYGFSYAVFPYLAPAARGGPDVIKALAEKLNWAGEKCGAAGLKFAYHNHAFEFDEVGGSPLFHILLDNTDPKLVGFELDAFWVSVAGHDPAEMITHIKDRVRLLHLKDKAEGTPVMHNESVPRTAFKEVGHGTIDWPKVLRAAASAGVAHYFVEQDQTPGDPLDSLRQSYQYLSKLTY